MPPPAGAYRARGTAQAARTTDWFERPPCF